MRNKNKHVHYIVISRIGIIIKNSFLFDIRILSPFSCEIDCKEEVDILDKFPWYTLIFLTVMVLVLEASNVYFPANCLNAFSSN